MGLANDFYDRAQQDFDRAQRDWETEPDYFDFDDPREVCGMLAQMQAFFKRIAKTPDTELVHVHPEYADDCADALGAALQMISKDYVASMYGVCAAPEVLRAEWEQETDKFVMLPPGEIVARCSNCHEHGRHTFRYCPYCGAFMTKHKGR